MRDLGKKSKSVLRQLTAQGPGKDIPNSWILRTGIRLDRRFARSERIDFREHGEFLEVSVRGQIFLWPKESPRIGIVQVLSEIFTPGHPHSYFWGQTQLHKEDVVLDIGASEGAFSAVVTSRCKRVIAVEPSRTMCGLITELFRLRGEPCPLILNCLLGSASGNAYFLENKSNPGESQIVSERVGAAYEVPVRTLDEIAAELEEKPSFIKCDAEGAEPLILNGGREFLRAYHPKIAITAYHNDGDYSVLRELLRSLGYSVTGKGLFYSPATGTLRPQMLHAWAP